MTEHNALLRGKRVLVTGAAGFIGSQLVRKLLDCGSQVSVLIRPGADPWRLQDVLAQLEIYAGDLGHLSFQEIQSKIFPPQIIYHLGATGVDSGTLPAEEIFKTNILGTWTLLQLAQHLKVERFIHCGSCFEYGSGNFISEDIFPTPVAEYGFSKVSAWMLARMFHQRYALPVVSLRPFTVYGPFEGRHRLIPQIILNGLDHVDIELTAGKQTRDFIFMDDLLDAFVRAAVTADIIGETFNISTGKSTSVEEIVLTILRLLESPVKALFGVRPYRPMEIWSLSGNPTKAKNKLHWETKTSLEEGLQKSISWFRENRKKYSAYY